MRKNYILDTSALIHDPFAYKKYHNSDVIIPISVLNELDKLKKQAAEVGQHARVSIRALDEISSLGDISVGVLIDNDILLKIDTAYNVSSSETSNFGDPLYGDTQILICAYNHWLENNDTTLVSNDINLRIKAKARGLFAEPYEDNKLSVSDLYSGVQTINNEDAGIVLQKLGSINPMEYDLHLLPNECILFEGTDSDGIAMGRKISENKIKVIKKCYPWNIASKNKEQAFAIDLIMDPNIDLITLSGISGTGKTLITLATALELVLNRRDYEKLVIYRPIQSVGKDIGFLPGTRQEKLEPWFQAILDNFEVLFSNNSKNSSDWKKDLEMYQKRGRIEMEAISYIRGRSIPNSILFIDEVQNISREDIKTILTRAGENTKVILTGDIEQIDNNKLDASDNGLTYIIEKFKNSELAGHITFTQGERSRLATLSAKIL